MNDITVYRVRQPLPYRHPDRSVRPAWYARTWQAEWGPSCPWAPRAFTEAGVRRKAARWRRGGLQGELRRARRKSWVRAHISQRRDPFYAHQRCNTPTVSLEDCPKCAREEGKQ